MLRSAELAKEHREYTAEELLRVCADLGDSHAWELFIGRFHPVICATVVRTGRRYAQFQSDLCGDLVQEVYLKLSANNAKALREFVPRHAGSAFGYVQVIAVRVTHDCLKSKGFRKNPETAIEPPDVPAPDETEWRQLTREIDECLRRTSVARDRHVFWLYYRQGMTAGEIAAIPAIGLSVKGVESLIQRLNILIRENL